MGYSSWGHKELGMTDWHFHDSLYFCGVSYKSFFISNFIDLSPFFFLSLAKDLSILFIFSHNQEASRYQT